MFNNWERKGVWRNQHNRMWMEVKNEVHTFVVIPDQDHQNEWNPCRTENIVTTDAWHRVFARYEVLCFMMWVKKRRYLICITIARNWRLHMDLSTHLVAVHSACSRRRRSLGIAKLPQTLNPFFLLWDYNYIVLSLVLGLIILRLLLIGFKSAQILDILYLSGKLENFLRTFQV